MAPERKNPQMANKPTIPTIYGFLPLHYHYKLQVTSNGQIHPGFLFGAPPEHLTRVSSNPKLTKMHCRIMSAGHMYCRSDYKRVSACIHCNITGTITWINKKGHRAALKNIWLAPGFTSQEDQLAKAKKYINRMIAFFDKVGEMYRKEITEWEKKKCKWEATITIKLAKQRRSITWNHFGTNEPLEDLAGKTPNEILGITFKEKLGMRHWD